jgi:hypothetical protein
LQVTDVFEQLVSSVAESAQASIAELACQQKQVRTGSVSSWSCTA